MAEFIYIVNSNLTIEGMRLSAVKTGKARSFQDSIDNKRFEDACRSLDDLPDNVKKSCESFQKFGKRSILNKKIVFPNLLRYRIFRVYITILKIYNYICISCNDCSSSICNFVLFNSV